MIGGVLILAGILLAELPEQKVRKTISLKKRAVNHI